MNDKTQIGFGDVSFKPTWQSKAQAHYAAAWIGGLLLSWIADHLEEHCEDDGHNPFNEDGSITQAGLDAVKEIGEAWWGELVEGWNPDYFSRDVLREFVDEEHLPAIG